VVFPQPAQKICKKWQLASSQGISHVICMPHITRDKIDELLADMVSSAQETT
jgi:histidine decarboxylase